MCPTKANQSQPKSIIAVNIKHISAVTIIPKNAGVIGNRN